jgi:glycosyltransferase involved in cell wall biosynthesis
MNLSSPWAFDNSRKLELIAKFHFAWAFNEIGTARIRNCKGALTEAWPVYESLKEELNALNINNLSIELMYVGIQNRQNNRSNLKNLNRKKIAVGWIGRLSPEKDPLKYIDLAHTTNYHQFNFSMAGDGPLRKKVLSKLRDNENFNFLGFVESSSEYLEKLNILILTSNMEGIPLVAMEALQLGVYVIAPNIGGLPDLLKDRKNGLLYDGSRTGLLNALTEAREIVLSNESDPVLDKKFLEASMFSQIDSRISHFQRLRRTKRS